MRLLTPYVEARLDQAHTLEKEYDETVAVAWEDGVAKLQSGTAAGFNYDRHKRAAPAEQDVLVQTYLQSFVGRDRRVEAAREKLAGVSAAVPATLDLAMAHLQRGQAQTAPQARRQDLERAEQLFLAVRSFAEDSNDYRLFYGQVCYWLGKHDEGKKQFDDLLAASGRSVTVLLSEVGTLREVGLHSEARTLAEEAYNKATDEKKKYYAANLRSLLNTGTEDEIEWLNRCDPSDPQVRGSLSLARGAQAMEKGDDEGAVRHFQQSLDAYLSMAKSTSSLNNASLVASYLYPVTSKNSDIERSRSLMEKAYSLQPGNNILLHNLARVEFQVAVADTVGDAVDLRAVDRIAGLDLLPFLYANREERDRQIAKLSGHPEFAKAVLAYDKLLFLAPKNVSTYATLLGLFGYTRDLEALRGLAQRLESASPDLSETTSQSREYYAGAKDAECLERFDVTLKKAESLARKLEDTDRTIEFALATSTLVENLMEAHKGGPERRSRRARLVGRESVHGQPVVEHRVESCRRTPFPCSEAPGGQVPAVRGSREEDAPGARRGSTHQFLHRQRRFSWRGAPRRPGRPTCGRASEEPGSSLSRSHPRLGVGPSGNLRAGRRGDSEKAAPRRRVHPNGPRDHPQALPSQLARGARGVLRFAGRGQTERSAGVPEGEREGGHAAAGRVGVLPCGYLATSISRYQPSSSRAVATRDRNSS